MVEVCGPVVDTKTRCVHYRSSLDIIAIKFRCCGRYYPCYLCHEETSDHKTKRWNQIELDSGEKVILCGECRAELTFDEYRNSGALCSFCNARFNPNCALHYNIYFELEQISRPDKSGENYDAIMVSGKMEDTQRVCSLKRI